MSLGHVTGLAKESAFLQNNAWQIILTIMIFFFFVIIMPVCVLHAHSIFKLVDNFINERIPL